MFIIQILLGMNIDTHGHLFPSLHSHEEHLALPGGYDLPTTDGNILHRHPLCGRQRQDNGVWLWMYTSSGWCSDQNSLSLLYRQTHQN